MGWRLKVLLLAAAAFLAALPRIQSRNDSIAHHDDDDDAFALRHLRYSLQVRNFYWPKAAPDPCSSWRGIRCDEQRRVVGIHLAGLKRTLAGMRQPSLSLDPIRRLSLLRSLNASGFHAQGSLPSWIGELANLELLDLSSCAGIDGSIPASLGQLTKLKFLSLAGNNLTGDLPYSLANLAALELLNLSANSLGGGGLDRLGSLREIERLDLSRNRFTDSIPAALGNLTRLEELDLSRNSIVGGVPASLGSLARLRRLDLSRNALSGPLPRELAALRGIRELVLSHNALYGELPRGMPAGMAIFDVAGDYLRGGVPDEIARVAALAGNCLENVARQRFALECRHFYASRGLAFAGPVGMLPTATPVVGLSGGRVAGKRRRQQHVAAILGGVLGSFGFILVVVAAAHSLQLRESRSKRKISSSNERSAGGSMRAPGDSQQQQDQVTVNLSCIGEAFSFAQLQRSTQDFNRANLIKAGHTGELYRGVLDGGLLVVVKCVDVSSSSKRELLLAELELFSKASHTRLVSLLGHCLERDSEKFLVYRYMQHGDLAHALHRKIIPSTPKDVLQSLDWITRLKIAIGAAEGLTYLHHECSPSLVHRDIKATSILLDDKFEVRLGSLSEARIQDGGLHPNLIMRFLRRSQTSEQDPDSPVASCAYDVYCFGKVLLELVSGKLGISGTMEPGADAWVESILPLIDRHEKENLSKIVDPSLLVDDDLLEEVWAVAIVAKMCLNPKPSRRPAIRRVLKALENPQRVVRDENFTASLRRSSHSSWNGSLFGSWRHSSSETVIPATLKEDQSLQQQDQGGAPAANRRKHSHSQGSLQDHHHSSHHQRRPGSSEIFPEP